MSVADVIAKRIRTLCKQRNLSTNKLATMSGVSQSTLASILSGKVGSPKLDTVMQLAIGLNMNILEFLDDPDIVMYSFDESDEELE